MKRHNLILAGLLTAVISGCYATPQGPQSFADLLDVVDNSDAQICTLPVLAIKSQMSDTEWEAAKEKAFDYSEVIARHADDSAAQIKTIFRRAALKRRLNVDADTPNIAQKFYDSFEPVDTPVTLDGIHDRLHYWMDRIAEQDEYKDPAEKNLRFCVMNERRAALHAASRKDILARVKAGENLTDPALLENINHESSFDDGFVQDMLAQIYTAENVAKLSQFERAKMRGRQAVLPFDPKTADAFWAERDAEIDAVLAHLQTHSYAVAADKLELMTDIDQSLRMMWAGSVLDSHFTDPEELKTVKAGIGERIMKVDEFNTAELEKMLEGRGWFRDDIDGSGAASNAWLIAQHADRNPAFQQKALKLIEADLDAPGVSKRNYAYLYDRVQSAFGSDVKARKKQRYATQGRCTGPGTWEPLAVEDLENIDAIRAEVGLGTLSEYKSRFKDMCKEDQR
jgi:hypothetical protein